MITPPTNSFFAIHVKGEATDHVVRKLSPSTMADIREVILISNDYASDIQAHHDMDVAVDKLQDELGRDVSKLTKLNPLYIPSTQDQVDEVLEGDPSGDSFKFVGMDTNPYTMKSVELTLPNSPDALVVGRIACHEFPLPSYTEIISAQKNVRLQ